MFDFSSLAESLKDRKLVRFALVGAAGCLVGAALGELLLAATRSPGGPAQAVCLLIDCSGSMLYGGGAGEGIGQKLHEVKAAAEAFVARHDSPDDRVAVVGFGTRVHRAAKPTSDQAALRQAIEELYDGGGTAMSAGLKAAADELTSSPELASTTVPRSILLFTDGQPDNAEAALAAAKTCREQQVRIVAIGTGDADVDYLGQITGDAKLVFHTDSGSFDEGFKQAEKAIYGGSLVEASSRSAGFWRSLWRTAAWTALAALGVSLALVAGQNLYVHRTALAPREAAIAAFGGLTAGIVGGAIGQLPFALASAGSGLPVVGPLLGWTLVPLGRAIGWAVLGAIVGRGLAAFIPNLEPRRAAVGGALGGAAGGIAFMVALLFGATVAALLGAAILGGAIGLMLALVEAAYRQAWLEVRYGLKETITVSLGADPVRIGSDSRACQVYARGARALACQYKLEAGRVVCVDYATETSSVVEAGHEQQVGGVTVTVRASRKAEGAAPAGGGLSAGGGMAIPAPPPARTLRPSIPAPPGAIQPATATPVKVAAPPPPRAANSNAPAAPASSSAPPASHGKPRVIHPVPPPPPPHRPS
ncbi:MAG TPA: vWA domain-containing protein [Pirellulales bacterium]|jgi:Ca-activated chloride channel family protein|nr:vWA domain-containing protein [Pirellulales bacterium]